MKKLMSFLIFSAFLSCAPAPEIKRREPLFKSSENLVVLSEKADREIILRKFKDSIQLRCDFFIDNRADFNLAEATAFSGFTVNVARQESPTDLLATMMNGQRFTTGVRVRKFDLLPEVVYTDETGISHVMRNSPVLELVVRGRDVLGNSDRRFQRRFILNEKNVVVITDLYPKKYPHILKCRLITTVTKEFESEYSVIVPETQEPEGLSDTEV